ncbi:MAG TPA: beta-glucosidase BglX [Lentisphaeria bacterium]|nr:MAG: hypothetical protein A2X47_12970 [Lentisphaerae bacterium GWF2_38_69]HBM14754.1 beta-glucosidase BglX [Lentisphaeria bacterium]
MRKNLLSIASALALSCSVSLALAQDNVDKKVSDLLSKMTLEEKIGQLTQYSGSELTGPQGEKINISEYIKTGKVGSVLNIYGTSEVSKYQKIAIEKSRLKIPLLFGQDVIHGYKTIFPVPIAMASSWDLDAVGAAQEVARNEATASGLNWTFTPMVDIARDPRWGRIVEGFGEDPYLASQFAKLSVEAFQGSDLGDETSMLATAKHYVGYGAVQAGRDYFTVDLSKRTLWEVFLPPFQAAINAQVASIMPAFTTMNGIPMTGNKEMTRDVLRNQLGFTGITVSDWNAINELIEWHVAANQSEAACEAIEAGVDIDMMSNAYINQLGALVKENKVPISLIDEAVARILKKKFELGLFEDPYKYCNADREVKEILSPENKAKARDVGKRSIVLLKNDDQTLPLSKSLNSIAVIGPLAEDTYSPMGPWFCNGSKDNTISVLNGIKQAVGKNTIIYYQKGCDVNSSDESMIDAAINTAKKADVIVAVLGENSDMSGEAASRSEIGLPGLQEKLLESLFNTGKPVVVVLLNGRPLTINWAQDHVQAIVEAWFPGSEAGHSIADVLFGDYNPSGKLPVTFPRSVGQIPIFYSHLNTGRPATAETKMLKYVSRYLDIDNSPLYPFGYGLSYTTFSYSPIELSASEIQPNDSATATVEVANTGEINGEEVVQLYIEKADSPIARPMQLKGFRKVEISAGNSVDVVFHIGPEELALYDIDMKKTVEKGIYNIYIGTSSVTYQKESITVK